MIKSEKFLASLLPNFEQARITETIKATRVEYTETIIPAYERTVKAFKANPIKLPEKLDAIAKANLPKYKGDIVATVLDITKSVNEKLTLCEDLVNEHFTTHVTKEGMTFAKANAIRFVETLDFTAMYARRLLLSLYVEAAVEKHEIEMDERFHQREINWLYNNFRGFCRAMEILTYRTKDLESKFKNIPHLSMVEGSVETAEEVVGRDKTDPVRLGFTLHRVNPIFHLRVIWENYMEARRKSAIEEARQLQLYLLLLEDENKATPATKREIAYSRERLAKVERKLRKMEEDAEDE